MDKPTRGDLLEQYAKKQVRHFLQVDGFLPEQCDDVVKTDVDGYGIVGVERWELRNTELPVRISILEYTKKKDALSLLKKAYELIKKHAGDEILCPVLPEGISEKEFVIKYNYDATLRPCAICGKLKQPRIGYEIFLENTGKFVCKVCGRKFAPDPIAHFIDNNYEAQAFPPDDDPF